MSSTKTKELIINALEKMPWAMTTQEIDLFIEKSSSGIYLRGLIPRKSVDPNDISRLVEKDGFAWVIERVIPKYIRKLQQKGGKPLFLYCLKKEKHKMQVRAFLELPGYLGYTGKKLDDLGWFLMLKDIYKRGCISESELQAYKRKDYRNLKEYKKTLGLSPDRIQIKKGLVYMKEPERKIWDIFTDREMLAKWKKWAGKYRARSNMLWTAEFYRREEIEANKDV